MEKQNKYKMQQTKLVMQYVFAEMITLAFAPLKPNVFKMVSVNFKNAVQTNSCKKILLMSGIVFCMLNANTPDIFFKGVKLQSLRPSALQLSSVTYVNDYKAMMINE